MNKTELINYLLLNSKKTLNTISTEIGVNRSNLYLWQKGKTKPTNANINNLAHFLGFDLKWNDKDDIEIINNAEDRKTINIIKDIDNNVLIRTQQEAIELQREKIFQLKQELNNLKKLNDNRKEWNSHKSTFNLYTSLKFNQYIDKNNIADNFIQSSKRIIEGNTSSLGYSNKELTAMSAKEFMMLYHPDSIKDGIKTMELLTENSNTIISLSGIRLLKSKDGKWVTYNCKMFWERELSDSLNWLLNAYYTELITSNT